MEFEDRHVTATPEGIRLDVVLAGLGFRLAAYAFDIFVQAVALIVFLVVLFHLSDSASASTGALVDAGAISGFSLLDFIGYFIVSELFFHGRSPGKRLAGLRVVRTDGQPVGVLGSTVRNVLRVADFLPAFNALGCLLILATTRNQRLGDLAAGTIVIRERVAAERTLGAQSWSSGAGFAAPAAVSGYFPPAGTPGPLLPPDLAHWDVSAVPAQELALARAFVANRAGYTPEARARLSVELAGRLWPYVAGPVTPPPAEAFVEMVVQVKAARG